MFAPPSPDGINLPFQPFEAQVAPVQGDKQTVSTASDQIKSILGAASITLKDVENIYHYLSETPLGEAHMMFNWLKHLYERLEHEVQPNLADMPENDADPDARYCAAQHLQTLIDIGVSHIHAYTQKHGNEIDDRIKNNSVATIMLYAAPRGEIKMESEQRLIKKLQGFAEGAMGANFQAYNRYIDAVWTAEPGTMKRRLSELV